MIRAVDGTHLSPGCVPAQAPAAAAASASVPFSQVLDGELGRTTPVRFSAHAQRRLDSRDVALSGSDRLRLDRAVDELARKGSRESLVLMDRVALVVNVPNRTVITAMPQAEADSSIFTHIDSAMVLPKTAE